MSDWHAWRATGIGGSDIGALFGLSTFADRFMVWADKTGRAQPKTETDRMAWGKRLEPVIAEAFTERTGLHVVGEQTWCTHPDNAHHLATVDGFVAESPETALADVLGVWECKTGQDRWDDISDAYTAQVQWQMHVTGMAHAWVAYLRFGYDLTIWELDRDDELIGLLVDGVDKFWHDHIVADVPPDTTRYSDLSAVYPRADKGTKVVLDERIGLDLQMARTFRASIKHYQKQLDGIENRIKAALGDNEVGVLDGDEVVTWKQATRKGIDTKRLEADHPDLVAQYRTETTYRTLRIKEGSST